MTRKRKRQHVSREAPPSHRQAPRKSRGGKTPQDEARGAKPQREQAKPAQRDAHEYTELVLLVHAANLAEAELFKTELESHGIPAILEGEGAGVAGIPDVGAGVPVLVPEEFADQAAELIAELESAKPEDTALAKDEDILDEDEEEADEEEDKDLDDVDELKEDDELEEEPDEDELDEDFDEDEFDEDEDEDDEDEEDEDEWEDDEDEDEDWDDEDEDWEDDDDDL